MSEFAPRWVFSKGIEVGPVGLGSSYGLPAKDVERAFERGVNFFLWGSRRRAGFGAGLRNLTPRHRAKMVIAIQSYTRIASLLEWSVDRALRSLRTDYVDALVLAWWNGPTPPRIVERALALREKGKVKHLMVSCHHRPTFEHFIGDRSFDGLMVRYNAAHPGAEREVFPHLDRIEATDGLRPSVVAFTATRWGTLVDPRRTPAGEATPRASDCYRFALTNRHVDVCLTGPKDGVELDEALAAVERGPMNDAELAWMLRVGAAIRDATAKPKRVSFLDLADRIATFGSCGPKRLTG